MTRRLRTRYSLIVLMGLMVSSLPGGRGGSGTGADGSFTISTSKNINTDVLGSNRSTNADGIVTTVSSFASSTGGTQLTVASGTGFVANDEVLLINLVGDGTNNGNVIRHRFSPPAMKTTCHGDIHLGANQSVMTGWWKKHLENVQEEANFVVIKQGKV